MLKPKKTIARAKARIRKRLKDPGRRTRCERSASLKLEQDDDPPGDRGACEQKSESQGSE